MKELEQLKQELLNNLTEAKSSKNGHPLEKEIIDAVIQSLNEGDDPDENGENYASTSKTVNIIHPGTDKEIIKAIKEDIKKWFYSNNAKVGTPLLYSFFRQHTAKYPTRKIQHLQQALEELISEQIIQQSGKNITLTNEGENKMVAYQKMCHFQDHIDQQQNKD